MLPGNTKKKSYLRQGYKSLKDKSKVWGDFWHDFR